MIYVENSQRSSCAIYPGNERMAVLMVLIFNTQSTHLLTPGRSMNGRIPETKADRLKEDKNKYRENLLCPMVCQMCQDIIHILSKY